MKIIWSWSIDHEVDRILTSAGEVTSGFFRLQGFLPLPWKKDVRYISNGVYLPEIKYQNIKNFWIQCGRLDNTKFPLVAPQELINQTRSQMLQIGLKSPPTSTLIEETNKIIPQVISFLFKFVPSAPKVNSIVIHPSYFGTCGSFSLINEAGEVVLFPRIDQGIKTIVECLLTSILRENSINELKADWSETEFLIDWLIHSSSLSQILPTDNVWSGTLNQTRSTVCTDLQEESTRFLSSIGAPSPTTQTFSIKDKVVHFAKKPLATLTARELNLMSKLIELSPSPLNNDQIGDLIFAKEDKFSLSAISKTIERLRTKLEVQGISPHYLATASGIGYYLKN